MLTLDLLEVDSQDNNLVVSLDSSQEDSQVQLVAVSPAHHKVDIQVHHKVVTQALQVEVTNQTKEAINQTKDVVDISQVLQVHSQDTWVKVEAEWFKAVIQEWSTEVIRECNEVDIQVCKEVVIQVHQAAATNHNVVATTQTKEEVVSDHLTKNEIKLL